MFREDELVLRKSFIKFLFYRKVHNFQIEYGGWTGAVVRASDFGPKGSLVRAPAGGLDQVKFTPCLVLVKPGKRRTDDRLGQTVTRLETTLCLMYKVQGT